MAIELEEALAKRKSSVSKLETVMIPDRTTTNESAGSLNKNDAFNPAMINLMILDLEKASSFILLLLGLLLFLCVFYLGINTSPGSMMESSHLRELLFLPSVYVISLFCFKLSGHKLVNCLVLSLATICINRSPTAATRKKAESQPRAVYNLIDRKKITLKDGSRKVVSEPSALVIASAILMGLGNIVLTKNKHPLPAIIFTSATFVFQMWVVSVSRIECMAVLLEAKKISTTFPSRNLFLTRFGRFLRRMLTLFLSCLALDALSLLCYQSMHFLSILLTVFTAKALLFTYILGSENPAGLIKTCSDQSDDSCHAGLSCASTFFSLSTCFSFGPALASSAIARMSGLDLGEPLLCLFFAQTSFLLSRSGWNLTQASLDIQELESEPQT